MAANPRQAIDYLALSDFRHEIRRFLNFSEQAARTAGIEPRQHQALLAIRALPPGRNATVGFLADRLQIEHHTAVELANRLQKNRLVSRRRSQDDRREVMLRLTSRGERFLQSLTLLHRAELITAGPGLLRALGKVIGKSRPFRELGQKSIRKLARKKSSKEKP
jgi:DNA-binding MarR family transcriptional regulator